MRSSLRGSPSGIPPTGRFPCPGNWPPLKLLAALALGDELSAELEKISRVIDRRNRLVHGVIHIGFGRLGPQAPLEPVIYLLFENDGHEAPLQVDDHGVSNSAESRDVGDEKEELEDDVELGEFELKKYLNEAYDALDAGLAILARVGGVLPERTYGQIGDS